MKTRTFSSLRLSRWLLAMAFCLATGRLFAQWNPDGWIHAGGWNLLLPLLNLEGCSGGGPEAMKRNWVAPHRIGDEDPRAGDVWGDIDFDSSITADGFRGGSIFAQPEWFTLASLESRFPGTTSSLAAASVDLQAIVETINGSAATGPGEEPLSSDNVLAIATTYVENRAGFPLEVEICTTSDDSIQVWVNDKCVTNRSVCRSLGGDCDERSAAILSPGVSKIAVLAWDGENDWAFKLGVVRSRDGARYDDSFESELAFLGPDDDAASTQEQYCLDRTVSPYDFNCPPTAAKVTITGGGPGDPDQVVEVIECVEAACPDDLTIDNVTDGGVVSLLLEDYEPAVGDFSSRKVVGEDCGGDSDTIQLTSTEYVSESTTGGDIGAPSGDDFEYAFKYFCGDFDVVVEIIGKDLSISDRGQFGLMARRDLDTLSRFTMILDFVPEGSGTVGRVMGDGAGNTVEQSFVGATNPPFLRLTRRDGIVQTWYSENALIGTGLVDPCDDAFWSGGTEDDWTDETDDGVFVGFANATGTAGNCPTQTFDFRVIKCMGCVGELPPLPSTGLKIKWELPRSELDDGVCYDIQYDKIGETFHTGSLTGVEDGFVESLTRGFDEIRFDNQQTGPFGDFANSHDIGDPATVGSTIHAVSLLTGEDYYTLVASGDDIGENGDQFRFAYLPVSGDFEMVARITSRIAAPNSRWGKHGLMARWSCDDDAKFSMVQTNLGDPLIDGPRHAFRVYHRFAGEVRDHYVVEDGHFSDREPEWMKMIRCGPAIYTYLAELLDDGVPLRWCLVGSDTDPNLPHELLAGMALTSHAGAETAQIVFDRFSVEPYGKQADACGAEDLVFARTFDAAPLTDIVAQKDPTKFKPQIVGSRLRLTRESSPDTANAVWFRSDNGDFDLDGFVAQFDVFLTRGGATDDANADPDAGLTFVAIESAADLIGAPPLGLGSLVGDEGDSLGYEGFTLRERTECHASLAIELDLVQAGGEPANEPWGAGSPVFDGTYHAGVDINAAVSSVQTNYQFGVQDLPDAFKPTGVHVEIQYQPTGSVEVWLSANDGSYPRTQVLETFIAPLQAGLYFGFTASTGGRTVTQEVDNLFVHSLCCDDPGTVSIQGPDSADVGTVATLTAVVANIVAPAYRWEIISGNGTLAGDTSSSMVELTASEPGAIVVRLTVRDDDCVREMTTEHTVVFGDQPDEPVFHRGDVDDSGVVDITDPINGLIHLFLGTFDLRCADAADTDDSGVVDITDPILLLTVLFLGIGEIPDPAPAPAACGPDETEDGVEGGDLGCEAYTSCE